MNLFRKRSKWALFVAMVLLVQIVLPYGVLDTRNNIQVSAASEKAKAEQLPFKILEIVSTGDSQLKVILPQETINTYQIEITTMTMKKFVALRDELDGKYDAIAIMDGKNARVGDKWIGNNWGYTSTEVKKFSITGDYWVDVAEREALHNTTAVKNDITQLRATEIVRDFINKGQLVLLHQDSIETGKVLNFNFQKYISTDKKMNVQLYSNQSSLNGIITQYLLKENSVQRPRMTAVLEPPANSQRFVPGESLTFNYSIQYPNNIDTANLSIRIYIDADFNDKYDSGEIVVQHKVTDANGQISYILPKGYSGIRNWKVELVDNGSNLKDYQVGRIQFKDQLVKVKVLQVMPTGSEKSNLNLNLNEAKLVQGDYNITVTPITMQQFNDTYYNDIERNYDMIIFGFGDMYNELSVLSDTSIKAVTNFAEARKSIMFTHDTIYRKYENNIWKDNAWVTNFMEMTGQKKPETNLGYQALLKTTKAKIVNEGLMTEYPYALSNDINIALTHNQYYTLDLEDPTIIPWYNIVGSNRDENDSYNHFYTYSKGNITYSGTGHEETGFPEDEQKLFVNTMYRAFLGSNQAPIITMNYPENNDNIPINQNIELSYSITDYNLNDRILKTKIYINDKLKYSKDDVPNGSTIVESLPHGMLDKGPVNIRIEAEDEHGAISEQELSVNVYTIDTGLEVVREIVSEKKNPIEVDTEVQIKYTITPKTIPDKEHKIQGDKIVIDSIKFIEEFPKELTVLGDDVEGNEKDGYKITRALEPIIYERMGDDFVAQPVTFIIKVIPKKNQEYILNKSQITFKDINNPKDTVEVPFNNITINAQYPLTKVIIEEKYELNKEQEYGFLPDLTYEHEESIRTRWQWSVKNPEGKEVLKVDPITGQAVALGEGTATLIVKVTDSFGNVVSTSTEVTVRIPITSIDIKNIELYVGEQIPIPFTVDPDDDVAKNSLTFSLDDNTKATIKKEDFTIKGTEEGDTKIHVTGVDASGQPITATANVIVRNYDFKVDPDVLPLGVNEEYDGFTITFTPEATLSRELKWESSNTSIVQVMAPGKIKGLKTGEAEIRVTSEIFKDKVEIVKVIVGHALTGIKGENVKVKKGDTEQAKYELLPYNASNVLNVKYFIEEKHQKYAMVGENTGLVKGLLLGEVPMTIVANLENGTTISTTVKVTITNSDGSSDNDKY